MALATKLFGQAGEDLQTALESIENLQDRIIIVDNEPRNKAICKILHNKIKEGHRVVIWPDSVTEKDINDMVIGNLDVEEIINYNTFQNLEAELKFRTWRKC